MQSFLEYLREKRKQEKLAEDAVVGGADAGGTTTSSAGEVVSPATAQSTTNVGDCLKPSDAAQPMTDNSVLGKPCKDKEDCGFFGKGDFRIPCNVLSGDVDIRIPSQKKKNPYLAKK